MNRGEVWWANLPRPDGRRPVLLISRTLAYDVRAAVTVAALTRTIRSMPSEVALDASDGLPAQCVVNADVLFTVSKSILGHRITTLAKNKMDQVDEALRFSLDL